MRKLIIVTIIVLGYGSTKAQIDIGFKLGTGFTKLQNMDGARIEFMGRDGLLGGLLFNYSIDEAITIQTGVNYLRMDGRKEAIQEINLEAIEGTAIIPTQPVYANVKNIMKLNYIQIPILAKLTGGTKVKYYMVFGPSFSIIAGANRKLTGESPVYLDKEGTTILKEDASSPPKSYRINYTGNITDQIKKINLGVQSGCGIEFLIKSGTLFFDGNLLIGATNINKYPAKSGKQQTNAVLITGGYTFRIK